MANIQLDFLGSSTLSIAPTTHLTKINDNLYEVEVETGDVITIQNLTGKVLANGTKTGTPAFSSVTLGNGNSVTHTVGSYTEDSTLDMDLYTGFVYGFIDDLVLRFITRTSLDITPDPFTFDGIISDASRNTDYTRVTGALTGFNSPTQLVRTSGTATFRQWGSSDAFTSSLTGINPSDRIEVKMRSSTQFSTEVTSGFYIGTSDLNETFSITTLAEDTAPSNFNLSPQYDAEPSTEYFRSYTVEGINTSVTVSVTGGSYRVNSNVQYTTSPSTVSNGDTIQIKLMSPANWGEDNFMDLHIGTGTDRFEIFNKSIPVPPNPPTLLATQNREIILPLANAPAIQLSEVMEFFGQDSTPQLTDYLRGERVPNLTNNATLPTAVPISLTQLKGKRRVFSWLTTVNGLQEMGFNDTRKTKSFTFAANHEISAYTVEYKFEVYQYGDGSIDTTTEDVWGSSGTFTFTANQTIINVSGQITCYARYINSSGNQVGDTIRTSFIFSAQRDPAGIILPLV